MLSIMGEENYNALVLEAEVFMDYFNSCYAPILDDFAAEFGENIGDNSLRLNAYKSYLATLLLSSDVGEYLYTIATRVYAEYTILEYLAHAGDDYISYYCYANNIFDEDGNIVDSYNYGTFSDLVRYENEFCGNSNPTFTFNFKKAFNLFYERKNDSGLSLLESAIGGASYNSVVSQPALYSNAVYRIVDFMNSDYEPIYRAGFFISERGTVVDKDGKEVLNYSDRTYVYCYMIHVYWSIRASIGMDKWFRPEYLDNYYDYLTGNLSRWNIFSDKSTEDIDQYFSSYLLNSTFIEAYRLLSFTTICRLYLPHLALGENNSLAEKVCKLAQFLTNSGLKVSSNSA